MNFITFIQWMCTPSKIIYITDTLRIRADIFPDAEWIAYTQEKKTAWIFSWWEFAKDDNWWYRRMPKNTTKENIKREYN